ncbi:MAG: RHS repeat-associated core domain-containing protein, partial [Myxococcota bacterium]
KKADKGKKMKAQKMGKVEAALGAAGVAAGAAGAAAQAAAGNSAAAIAQGVQAGLDAAALAMAAACGKDPSGLPGVGLLVGPNLNVLAGGLPMPNLGAMAMGKIYGALGKAFKSLSQRLRRQKPPRDANGHRCSGGEPVHLITGEVYNTHHDFMSLGRGFRWSRYTTSGEAGTRGVLGWGWRHRFECSLEVRLHRATFTNFDGEEIAFPRLTRDDEVVHEHGFSLRSLGPTTFEVSHRRLGRLRFVLDKPSSIHARLSTVFTEDAQIDLHYDRSRRLCELSERTFAPPSITARYSLRYSDEGALLAVWGSKHGEPSRQLCEYVYDDEGNLAAAADANGARQTFTYDHGHRIVAAVDRNGYRFEWTYDHEGRCVHTQGQDGQWFTKFRYVPSKQLTRMFFHDGSEQTVHYDEDGVVTKIVDPLGGELRRERELDGRIVAEVDAGGRRIAFEYDQTGGHTARVDRFGHIAPPELDAGAFGNPFGWSLPETPQGRNLGEATDNLGTMAMSLEPAWRQLPEVAQARARLLATPPARHRPAREYDGHGGLVREVDEAGHEQRWQRDHEGNVVRHRDRDGRVHRRTVTGWNLLGATTDPCGHRTEFEYDPHERVTRVVDPLGTETRYEYDAKGRLTAVFRHGELRERYAWDVGDRLVGKSDANDRVLVEITPHDNALPGSIALSSGDTVTLDYDRLGNTTVASTDAHALCRDFIGDRLRMEDCDGRTIHHGYGSFGRFRTAIAGRFVTHVRSHGTTGRRITDPTGRVIQLQTHRDGCVSIDHGNGTHELQRYEEGRLATRLACGADGTAWEVIYEYTPEGDLVRTTDGARGERRFDVDAAHRLVGETLPDGTKLSYELDAAGNVCAKPGLAGVRMDRGNRLKWVGDEAFEYDDRGHVAARRSSTGTTVYTRDSLDQLVRVDDEGDEPWTATYDGLGRRTSFGRGSRRTTLWWDGDRLGARTNPDGALRIYTYLDGKALVPIGFVDYDSVDAEPESGRSYAVFCDQVGLPQHIQDAEGRVVWWADATSPYGEVFVRPGAELEYNLRWPGHYYDDDLGLHYNRFRDYDPRLGRYLSSDPIGCAGGINVYAYAANPLVAVDVLGLSCGNSDATTETPGTPLTEAPPFGENGGFRNRGKPIVVLDVQVKPGLSKAEADALMWRAVHDVADAEIAARFDPETGKAALDQATRAATEIRLEKKRLFEKKKALRDQLRDGEPVDQELKRTREAHADAVEQEKAAAARVDELRKQKAPFEAGTPTLEPAYNPETGQLTVARSNSKVAQGLKMPKDSKQVWLPGVCGMPHAASAAGAPSSPVMTTDGGLSYDKQGNKTYKTRCRNCAAIADDPSNRIDTSGGRPPWATEPTDDD